MNIKDENFRIPVNKYQTPIDKELIDSLEPEVAEQLLDCIENIDFIKRLISPDRKYAKDLPRDTEGKIIIDLANPHILENMDYFRPSAKHFEEHGCYTFLKPNKNPNSEFYKWGQEEKRRCREGYIRPEDGEWVTGYMYWFINYCPIMLTKTVAGKAKADRVEGFPEVWEGLYWRFHYLEKARQDGKHAIELARRGAHPYFQKVFTPEGWKQWEDINIGDKLYGTDGNLCTVIDIPYDKESPYYKITLRDGREVYATDDHLWNILKRGELITVNTAWLQQNYFYNRIPSYRIPSRKEFTCFIPSNHGVEMPKLDVKVDPYTFGLLLGDGCFRAASCYYTQDERDILEELKYIPYDVIKWSSKDAYRLNIPNWAKILSDYTLKNIKSEDKFIPDEFKYNTKEIRLNLLKGLLDTDGYVHGGVPALTTSSKRLVEDAMFIARSLGYNTSYSKKKAGYKKNGTYKRCLDTYEILIYGGNELFNLPRKKALVHYNSTNALSRKDKTGIIKIEYIGVAPCKCVTVDSKDNCYLVGDFITTHNCGKSYSLAGIMSKNLILGESSTMKKRVTTILTGSSKEFLSDKDGTLSKFEPMIDFIRSNTEFPKLRLRSSSQDMFWQSGYLDSNGIKRGSLNTVMGLSAKDDADKIRGKRGFILFEEMGKFGNLLNVYDIARNGLEEGDYTFGMAYLVGTANEKESDFTSAKTLLYNPDGYNLEALENVYDKHGQGKLKFGFFFPSYINRKGCYNEDGVSDVVKALIQILNRRFKEKHGSDPNSVIRVIAEQPITPAEAMIKVKSAYFPVTALTERLQQLDLDSKAFDDVYVGALYYDKQEGCVKFKNTNDIPIRKFHGDQSLKGAVEIFEMPERDSSGKVFSNRYIIGHDPVDNDEAESSSLSSTIVLDLFTDRIVAEYTGRQEFADDNFEILRLLCLFFNAKCCYESNKKGCFTYFQKMQCTHLLADTPEYLRDKQLVKYSAWGSNAKGVNASSAINNYANSLIRDWLLKPVLTKVTENGEEKMVPISNLNFIRNRALLEELIAFNPEINVDRIRALGMVMLYREQMQIWFGDSTSSSRTDTKDPYSCNDDFFERNYMI